MAHEQPDFQPGQILTVEKLEPPGYLVVTTASGGRYRAQWLLHMKTRRWQPRCGREILSSLTRCGCLTTTPWSHVGEGCGTNAAMT